MIRIRRIRRWIRRRALWLLVLSILLGVIIVRGNWPFSHAIPPVMVLPTLDSENRPVRVDYDKTPFAEALADLSRQASLPIVCNTAELEADARGTLQSEVTLKLNSDGRRVTFRRALQKIIDAVDNQRQVVPLFYPDRVVLTTENALKTNGLLLEIEYPIHDLVGFYSPWQLAYNDPATSIRECIMRTIEPNEWIAAGAHRGTIEIDRGVLVVKNTPSVHYKIDLLLQKLRQSN